VSSAPKMLVSFLLIPQTAECKSPLLTKDSYQQYHTHLLSLLDPLEIIVNENALFQGCSPKSRSGLV
jgi:hypothetical protein